VGDPKMPVDPTNDRCPVCGEGTLTDLAFDAGDRLKAKPAQTSDSRQLLTYSCGHTSPGPRLDTADANALVVERRASKDVVDPTPD